MADWLTDTSKPYVQDQATTGGINWNDFYGSVSPGAAPSTVAANAGIRPTPAQLAAMQAVPGNSYQTPPNQPIFVPNQPSGYSYADTGDQGRATGMMTQQLALAGSGIQPAWTIPNLPAAPTWNRIDQAAYDARNDPNTWMAQSRMQAQALMRQRAVQQANAGGGAGPAASAQPGSVASPPSLPPPLTIQGTATGNSYNVGQTYQNGNGTYVANPDGTFTRIAGPAPAPANYSANGTRYSRGTDANGNNQSLTAGSQSNAGIGTDEKVALALSQAPSLAGKRAR